MKKLMILGASELQLPAIKKAKEMGYYVIVIDYDKNAIGIQFSDEHYTISTIDSENVLKIAQKVKPDGIMTLATDMPMKSIALVASELNIPGISKTCALKTTNKGEMINALNNNNVEVPWHYIVCSLEELSFITDELEYPLIIKPIDNSGSRGVTIVNSADEIQSAFYYSQKFSRSGFVIIEEFLQGNEVSVEIMLIEGEPHVLAVTDKLTTGEPFFVEMGHIQPSQLSSQDTLKVKDLAKRAVKAVNIDIGPAHVEIMLTADGPKVIELGARLGGDHIATDLVPLSTGIDYVKATIQSAMGEKPDINSKAHKVSMIKYLDAQPGILKGIYGLHKEYKDENIIRVNIAKKIGDEIDTVKNSSDRVGYVIVQAKDKKEANKSLNKVVDNLKIEVEK